MNRKSVFSTVAAYCFVALFIYASFSKILDFELFQIQIAQSPILSAFAGFVSYVVVIFEITVAFLLVFDKTRLLGLYLSTGLMISFTVYIYLILNYSEFIPCSCGGVLEKLNWQQHLFFNLGFTLLGICTIINLEGKNRLLTIVFLARIISTIFFGGISILLLFLWSEQDIKRDNNFIRRYLPHAITEIESIEITRDLTIVGNKTNSLVLYDHKNPFQFTEIDKELKKTKIRNLYLPKNNFLFRYPQLSVTDSVFYFADGSVPVVMNNKSGAFKIWIVNQFYFDQLTETNQNEIYFRTMSAKSKSHVLGYYKKELKKPILSEEILKWDKDGVFETDGELFYDPLTENALYQYRYKGQFTLISDGLRKVKQYKTIDNSKTFNVISKRLKSGEHKMAAPSKKVNRAGFFYGGLFFNQSNLVGKYEDSELWKNSAVIDLYDINEEEYVGSFFIPIIGKNKDIQILIADEDLYVISEKKLRKFRFAQNILKHFSKVEAEKPQTE